MQNNNKSSDLDLEYVEALNLAKEHYENFPVVGLFVPKSKRKYVAVIYKFARQADDIADEGSLTQAERMNLLNNYSASLQRALNGNFDSTFWETVADTIHTCQLSHELFSNLLEAFKQDVVKNRYESFDDILRYCSNSANPVGRLILELNNISNETANNYSDKICTALQLANFWQDVSVDIEKGRIYLPQDDMEKFEVTENHLVKKNYNSHFRSLMQFEIERTKTLLEEGRQLVKLLAGRLRFQIKLTIAGCEMILRKIEILDFDTLNFRPTLSRIDLVKIFLKSLVTE